MCQDLPTAGERRGPAPEPSSRSDRMVPSASVPPGTPEPRVDIRSSVPRVASPPGDQAAPAMSRPAAVARILAGGVAQGVAGILFASIFSFFFAPVWLTLRALEAPWLMPGLMAVGLAGLCLCGGYCRPGLCEWRAVVTVFFCAAVDAVRGAGPVPLGLLPWAEFPPVLIWVGVAGLAALGAAMSFLGRHLGARDLRVWLQDEFNEFFESIGIGYRCGSARGDSV